MSEPVNNNMSGFDGRGLGSYYYFIMGYFLLKTGLFLSYYSYLFLFYTFLVVASQYVWK